MALKSQQPVVMRALLISTYELGHQPFGLAEPAAWLRRDGTAVEVMDLAVEPFDVLNLDDHDPFTAGVQYDPCCRHLSDGPTGDEQTGKGGGYRCIARCPEAQSL